MPEQIQSVSSWSHRTVSHSNAGNNCFHLVNRRQFSGRTKTDGLIFSRGLRVSGSGLQAWDARRALRTVRVLKAARKPRRKVQSARDTCPRRVALLSYRKCILTTIPSQNHEEYFNRTLNKPFFVDRSWLHTCTTGHLAIILWWSSDSRVAGILETFQTVLVRNRDLYRDTEISRRIDFHFSSYLLNFCILLSFEEFKMQEVNNFVMIR